MTHCEGEVPVHGWWEVRLKPGPIVGGPEVICHNPEAAFEERNALLEERKTLRELLRDALGYALPQELRRRFEQVLKDADDGL